ncbi:hypothetical protein HK096_000978, partial [Nowakowskiella sp. JEL0078]
MSKPSDINHVLTNAEDKNMPFVLHTGNHSSVGLRWQHSIINLHPVYSLPIHQCK